MYCLSGAVSVLFLGMRYLCKVGAEILWKTSLQVSVQQSKGKVNAVLFKIYI